jgi:hypothetical protein
MAFSLGFGIGVPVTALAALLGAGDRLGLPLFAVTAAAVGACCRPSGSVCAALPLWALEDGFVVHRFGVLTADHDALRALALVTLAAAVVAVAMRWSRGTPSGARRTRPVRPRPGGRATDRRRVHAGVGIAGRGHGWFDR